MHFLREGQGERKRGKESLMRERNIDHLPLVCSQTRGTNPQPRHVPSPGFEPVTLQFTRRRPANGATQVRAEVCLFFSFVSFMTESPSLCPFNGH